jgi:hypothetical protein
MSEALREIRAAEKAADEVYGPLTGEDESSEWFVDAMSALAPCACGGRIDDGDPNGPICTRSGRYVSACTK